MIQKILFLTVALACIFLCKNPIFAFFNKRNPNVNNIIQCLTKKEQEKLPLLIALSIKEMIPKNTQLASFIEDLKIAEQEKANSQKSLEAQVYLAYAMQLMSDPKIMKNLETSVQYLQKKQEEEGSISLIDNKICYKILKKGSEKGIDNKINKVTINFTIQDVEDNFLAGNYAISGPISCMLSELIPGMAFGMLGMRLHELREIYIHPEFAYGAFSDFGNGKALSIQVELAECEATDTDFYPCLLPVDLVKLHYPNETNIISLQKDDVSSRGKLAWSFYKQKLPQLQLENVLSFLQEENAVLSTEDRESLYKLQWLIYKYQ